MRGGVVLRNHSEVPDLTCIELIIVGGVLVSCFTGAIVGGRVSIGWAMVGIVVGFLCSAGPSASCVPVGRLLERIGFLPKPKSLRSRPLRIHQYITVPMVVICFLLVPMLAPVPTVLLMRWLTRIPR
jgi:hypothetical protein